MEVQQQNGRDYVASITFGELLDRFYARTRTPERDHEHLMLTDDVDFNYELDCGLGRRLYVQVSTAPPTATPLMLTGKPWRVWLAQRLGVRAAPRA